MSTQARLGALLVKLASEIGKKDHKALMFLFRDVVKRPEDADTPLKLLETLKQAGLLSDGNILVYRYSLIVIGRIKLNKDILKYYRDTGLSCRDISEEDIKANSLEDLSHWRKIKQCTDAELKQLPWLRKFVAREKLFEIASDFDNKTDLDQAKYWLKGDSKF